AEFTIPRDEVFFNTGTMGSSPLAVQEAVINHMRHVDRDIAKWDYKADHEQYFTGYFDELATRDALAKILNCSGKDLALTQNATFGMNFVAHGLELKAGDEVIVMQNAHTGGRRGFDLRAKRDGIVVKEFLPKDPVPDPDTLIKHYTDLTTSRTKVWAIPHITSARAIRFPVKRLCTMARERGIFSTVDGAQCVGHIAVDLQDLGCDAYFSSPHKWLLSPKGTGIFYLRPEHQKSIWCTLASGHYDDVDDPMLRMQAYGTGNLSLLKGLDVAIAFHQQIGSKVIEDRIVGLADRLRDGLKKIPGATIVSPTHPELRCATTLYGINGMKGTQLMDYLWQSKIRVRANGDLARHGCHIYNSEEDVDRTLALLSKAAKA
ncbi:MAG TPA: aminotransferase class V-fold PLP-dependent enzyme, partial [Gemmatimonadaceae bacterium]|nr:aminotransferase class V-fold PLP-dependent enzyme [Gemmatimonadaceae bacterium]